MSMVPTRTAGGGGRYANVPDSRARMWLLYWLDRTVWDVSFVSGQARARGFAAVICILR